jgi:hypothetical protein
MMRWVDPSPRCPSIPGFFQVVKQRRATMFILQAVDARFSRSTISDNPSQEEVHLISSYP